MIWQKLYTSEALQTLKILSIEN